MSESIKNIEDEIISEFEMFGDDWEGRYEHLIDLGRTIPLIYSFKKKTAKFKRARQKNYFFRVIAMQRFQKGLWP